MLVDCAKATNESIKWPAVKFIIKRSESVNGRRKQLISSTQDIKIANASAGKLAGVRCDGHQVLVIKELKKGVDHRGRAKDIVNKNCVVIVKLKGNKPLIFQASIIKQVNKKGVVNFLSGFKAEQSVLIKKEVKEFDGLEAENCFIKKGNKKGIANKIQFNWWKFEVPGSNMFNTWVIIYKNLFSFKSVFGGNDGLIVFLFVHVNAPIIRIIVIAHVILGLKVFNRVSFIKKQKE